MKNKRALLNRLTRYGAAAGIVAAGASSAQGSIVYFDNSHAFTVTPPPSATPTLNTHLWDIDNNATSDFQVIGQHTSYSFNNINVHIARIIGPPPNHFVVANTVANHNYTNTMKPLPLGFTIKATGMASGAKFQVGASLIDFTHQGVVNSPLTLGNQLVGFEFLISGTTHYGWADITIGVHTITINSWAYNSLAGASIQAGIVPEPADAALGLGLLALGAAGVSAYKRRKKMAA